MSRTRQSGQVRPLTPKVLTLLIVVLVTVRSLGSSWHAGGRVGAPPVTFLVGPMVGLRSPGPV